MPIPSFSMTHIFIICSILFLTACTKESFPPLQKTEIIVQKFTVAKTIHDPTNSCVFSQCEELFQKYQKIANEHCKQILIGIDCCDDTGKYLMIDALFQPQDEDCSGMEIVHKMRQQPIVTDIKVHK